MPRLVLYYSPTITAVLWEPLHVCYIIANKSQLYIFIIEILDGETNSKISFSELQRLNDSCMVDVKWVFGEGWMERLCAVK
jgi:hypothetical protein